MERHCQKEIFEAMARADFYPHPVGRLEVRETHISKVFLTGSIVYKFKKPVDLGFLDYSTLEKRRYFCEQETQLNRRLSRGVYLGAVPVTLDKGGFALDGTGKAVEYAVKMRQLPQASSMLDMLKNNNLDPKAIELLAGHLAEFYQQAETGTRVNAIGSWETIRTNCEENFTQMNGCTAELLDERKFQIIRSATRSYLHRRRALFNQRIAHGKIRDCHGDLRSGHIYFKDGIQIIDCIEFNQRFRYSDVTCDLAFLAMDLDFEGFSETARHLIDAYVRATEDPDAYALLDFYKCYRAMVRAKVNCFRLEELNPGDFAYRRTEREANQLLDLAYRYAVQFARPTLWVVFGMPAAGKSTIAEALHRIMNVKVLRSDVIRKKLFGLTPQQQVVTAFEGGIYSPEASSLTYGKLLLAAQEEVAQGNSVIVDATFSQNHQRQEALRLARDMDANVVFIECLAPKDLLIRRLKRREETASISDARLQHLDKMRERFDQTGDLKDARTISVDTAQPLDQNINRILQHDYFVMWQEVETKMS